MLKNRIRATVRSLPPLAWGKLKGKLENEHYWFMLGGLLLLSLHCLVRLKTWCLWYHKQDVKYEIEVCISKKPIRNFSKK